MRAAGPVLGARGLYRLHHWLVDGKNTLVVGGGDANVAFINGNCLGPDGGFSLEAERVLARFHTNKKLYKNDLIASRSCEFTH